MQLIMLCETPPSTDPPASGGAGIKFISTTSAGALVLLDSPGQSEVLRSKRRIVNYMYDNHQSWLEFANASDSFGLDLNEEDIIFVCGTIKTTKWAVAAFQGDRFRQKEGLVTGQFGPYASVDLSISISDQILPTEHYRHGPQRRPRPIPFDHLSNCPESTEPDLPHPPDQCLFVHYYKMKRRPSSCMVDSELERGAGVPQLPPELDDAWVDEFESEQRVDIIQVSFGHCSYHSAPQLSAGIRPTQHIAGLHSLSECYSCWCPDPHLPRS